MDSFADTQPLGGTISLEADFAVKAGCLESLQDLRALMLHHAAAGAQQGLGTMADLGFNFDAQLSPDSQSFKIRTGAQHEEALRQMLLRIGPDLAQLETSASLTRLHCTGQMSAELQKTLSRFNASFA